MHAATSLNQCVFLPGHHYRIVRAYNRRAVQRRRRRQNICRLIIHPAAAAKIVMRVYATFSSSRDGTSRMGKQASSVRCLLTCQSFACEVILNLLFPGAKNVAFCSVGMTASISCCCCCLVGNKSLFKLGLFIEQSVSQSSLVQSSPPNPQNLPLF